MKKTSISKVLHSTMITVIALVMILLPASRSAAAQPLLIPANVGTVGFGYDTALVKQQPTADNPESKVWFNDGIWWGILFDNASSKYFIHRLNGSVWVKTATEVDSRKDTDSTTVDTRFDALWDGTKLYLATHIQMANPAVTSNVENRGRVYRYSYDTGSDTYSLDAGFPAINVGLAKTTTMVLDKDSTGRLWVTYVARVPTATVGDPEPYQVWVNYTTPGNDLVWGTPKSLADFSAGGATVSINDMSSVIAYGDKVGVMWSNQLDGNFYYAEIDAGDNPQTAAIL